MLLKWFICATVFNLSPAFATLNQTVSYSQLIPCESGSYFFGERCYTLFGETNGLIWEDAANFCKGKQGYLVTVDTKELNDFLSAFFILQKKVNAWIGLSDREKESVYKWDDGSVVNYTNWAPNEPHPKWTEKEDCGEFRYKHSGKLSMWNDLECGNPQPFICQSRKNEATSSPDPRFCPVENGGGWKYSNSCYHIVHEERSWDDAEKYCQENFKGHLSTILDEKEDMFLNYLTSDFSKDFWIGIKLGNPTQLKWSSGWHVVYKNWSDEPGDFTNDTCALQSHQHLWTSTPCLQKCPFICEVSSDKPVVLDKGPEGGSCPDKSKDWIDLGGDKCYTVENEILNWDDANAVCMRKGGTLVVIESENEANALYPYVEEYVTMYIGLHRNSTNDDFGWIDGTPFNYQRWRTGEPDNKADEFCAELATYSNIEWNDVPCGNRNSFICSAKKIIKTCTDTVHGCCPDGKTAAKGSDKAGCQTYESISYSQVIPCETGSYFFGEKCYKLYAERNGLVWSEASNFCKVKHGSLVIINSKEVQDFLTAYLILQKRINVWIGLHDRGEESAYLWDDGSALNYTHWGPNEPTGSNSDREDCVELRFKHNGKTSMWNDLTCDHSLAFICQSGKSDGTSSHDSRFCPVSKGGGFKYLNSCYDVVLEEKSWDDAETYCQANFKGHLLTILDPKAEMFLDYVLSQFGKDFWIGIKFGNPTTQLKWSSGWHVAYNNWSDEPEDFTNDTCALKSQAHLWTSSPCVQTRPFICEASSEKPFVLQNGPEGGRCPDKSKDWIDLDGDKCYTFQNEYLKWDDANAVCIRKGGTLAVIESEEESKALHRYITEPHERMYIGLRRSSRNEDVFEWIDGTPSDYRKWRPNEPNSNNEKCGEVTTWNMEWNDVSCENGNPFLCSAKKVIKSCTDTVHGCCPDGKTAAKGPDNAGCLTIVITNCKDLVHGCCPDGKTAAEGPDQAGCPSIVNKSCTDTVHGCCPDGTTVAEGPGNAGCPMHTPSSHAPKSKGSDGFIQCSKGWFLFGEKCFKVGGRKRNDKMSWEKAADRCQRYVGGNLATIESKEEQDFLVSFLLLDVKNGVWIGLNDKVKESEYVWNDGSTVSYRNWKNLEPTGLKDEKEDCVQMLFEPDQDIFGLWNDNDCSVEIPYICQMKIHGEKKSPNPEYCSSVEGGGWKFQNSCYHVVTETKTWQNAEQHCKDSFNGHLVTVLDTTVDLFLDHILSNIKKELWIGIKIIKQYQQQWVSGWYVSYDGLNKDHADLIDGACVLRNKRKQWTMAACSKKYAFICEISKDRPPVLEAPLKGSHCPQVSNEWRDLGGSSCYYVETQKAISWYEANFDCKRKGGHLLSLHSKEESEILHPFIQFTQQRLFIGLLRQIMHDNAFVWSDGSLMNYANWGYEEPNNDDEKCGEIWTRYMEWNDVNCEEKKGYICSVRKVSHNTTTEEKTPCSGHVSYQALIGVSVCLILVIILFGVVVYCSCARDERRRKNSTALFIRPNSSLNNSKVGYRSQVESKFQDEDEEYYESMH